MKHNTLYKTEGATAMPMKNPPHPGDFIRTEIIEPAGLSTTAAAAARIFGAIMASSGKSYEMRTSYDL